jgi:DNA-binding MarR family transcriptional regulator
MAMRTQAKAPAADRIAERLHAAALHLLRHVRRADPGSGVPPAQLSALSVLVFRGSLSLTGLAAAEQVKPPTMTRVVDGLEASGLASRTPDPADRRAALVAATAKGRRTMMKARQQRLAIVRDLLAPLSARDRAVLDEASAVIERMLAGGR